jgi:5-methylcytosine-specific restriction endonuclease McrA
MSEELAGKICCACDTWKPYEDYHRNKRKKDGREPRCKDCNNARMRDEYARDPQKKITKTRQYHLDHPEWSKATLAAWHQEHAAERYDRYLELGKDPEVQARRRSATMRSEARRRAIKRGNDSGRITEEELGAHLEAFGNACWICHIDLTGEELHWDHVQPLAAGGAHRLTNLRPACGPCNVRKNGTWPITEERLDAIRRAVGVLRGLKEVD